MLRRLRLTTRLRICFFGCAGLTAVLGLTALAQLPGGVLAAAVAHPGLCAMTIAFAVTAAAFGLQFSSAITRPVEQTVALVSRIASGDLVSRIPSDGRDEFSWLHHELNQMRKQLQTIITEVRQSAEQVATAASQIASGNSDLSSRTESQASSLQHTASSMQQLTATVRQNAENAGQANSLASSTTRTVTDGGMIMSEVVAKMDDISQSSRRIAEIIGVIDSIAFQTNILALNAAVEAARAGEQGRGFSVVASEVRGLAQRSAAAAREIKALIDDSTAKVQDGARLVHKAGSAMDEILESVGRFTVLMGEISAASQEQSAGIGSINQSIERMDGVTQQNAALVEQAAAAAMSLREQAERLNESVKTFRLSA